MSRREAADPNPASSKVIATDSRLHYTRHLADGIAISSGPGLARVHGRDQPSPKAPPINQRQRQSGEQANA